MPPLSSSTLAPVSTGSGLPFYYQTEDKVFEATSQDGSSWKLNPDAVAKGLWSWGSPFSIHILYISSDSKLVEQFRYLSETKWETIYEQPAYRDISHQWWLSGGTSHPHHSQGQRPSKDGNSQCDGNLARTQKPLVHPDRATWQGRPAAWIRSRIRDQITIPPCVFHDHAGNIKLWENIHGWHDNGTQVKAADVSRQAAIAAATTGPSAEDKDHIMFPGSGEGATIKHSVDNKTK